MRVAAVDCGTNSIRLLIAELAAGDGPPARDVLRRMEIVRLGEGVDRTGELSGAAIARTRAACESYALDIGAREVSRVRFVATSATRDARNRDEFVAMVRDVLGVDPEVITGDEEARLSFRGARDALPAGSPAPILVVDIGGGSTECVLGDGAGPWSARSVDVGCVRLTERHLHSDPPTRAEIAAASADIAAALDDVARTVALTSAATFVGLAGSVTTVVAAALDLDSYQPERIHGARVSAADVTAACDRLLGMDRRTRARLPYMHPGRVDVIGGGALVLRHVLAAAGTPELVASEHDILDGIAAGLADAGSGPSGGAGSTGG